MKTVGQFIEELKKYPLDMPIVTPRVTGYPDTGHMEIPAIVEETLIADEDDAEESGTKCVLITYEAHEEDSD